MKALSVNTLAKKLVNFIWVAVLMAAASCQSTSNSHRASRVLTSAGSSAFEEIFLAPPRCPGSLNLEYFEDQISLSQCLGSYIHYRNNGGMVTQWECFVFDPLRISLLQRLYSEKKIHVGMPIRASVRGGDPGIQIIFGTNSQGYYVEVEDDQDREFSAGQIKGFIRSVFEKYEIDQSRVRLNRCECSFAESSISACEAEINKPPAPGV